MLKIKKPQLCTNDSAHTRLQAEIEQDGVSHIVWAEVDNKYTEYLCYERSDAFVIGLLHYAMKHNHDIVCEAPMGEYLYYQITTYLVDAISKGSPQMHAIHIKADVDSEKLPCACKIGTGISCGIDSLHVLACQSGTSLKRHNITHLAFNNVGSHGEGERAKNLFTERRKQAESFCEEYGFELTEVNSNIMDEFEQDHFITHTFTSMFAVFCLQKLYSIYYYASGRQFADFSLNDTNRDCSYYDLLLAEAFSTENMKIYSEGGTLSRLEKTRNVIEYPPSYKYLNVCTRTADNCNRCEKCTRTLLALDVLGKLDCYKNVFDIEYYRKHKQKYLKTLLVKRFVHNVVYTELYPYLKSQIAFKTRIKAVPAICKEYAISKLKQGWLRDYLKQIYHWINSK